MHTKKHFFLITTMGANGHFSEEYFTSDVKAISRSMIEDAKKRADRQPRIATGAYYMGHMTEAEFESGVFDDLKVTWSGKGRPPVGTECLACYSSLETPHVWYRAQISSSEPLSMRGVWLEGPREGKEFDYVYRAGKNFKPLPKEPAKPSNIEPHYSILLEDMPPLHNVRKSDVLAFVGQLAAATLHKARVQKHSLKYDELEGEWTALDFWLQERDSADCDGIRNK